MKVTKTVPKKKGKIRKHLQCQATNTRKEVRRKKRKDKKVKKAEFFQRKRNISFKSLTHHKCTTEMDVSEQQIGKDKQLKSTITRQILVKPNIEDKYQNRMRETRRKQLRAANHDEDRIIRKLEKRLKLNCKRNSVPKSFALDGLDYLLDICDQNKIKETVSIEQNLFESGSEFEEDFAVVTGRATSKLNHKCVVSCHGSDIDLIEDDETNASGIVSPVEEDTNVNSKNMYASNIDNDIGNLCVGLYESSNRDGSAKVDTNSLELGGLIESKMSRFHKDQYRNENVVECSNISDNAGAVMGIEQHNSLVRSRAKCRLIEGDVLNKVTRRKTKAKQVGQGVDDVDIKSKRTRKEQSVELKPVQKLEKKCPKHGSDLNVDCIDEDEYNMKSDCNSIMDHISSDSNSSKSDSEDLEKDAYWEDIYGRTRDEKGNVIQVSNGKYVSPHLRSNVIVGDANKQGDLLGLRKQVKGLLNRLAENNMSSVAMQLEKLYMTHSRNNMNETLTQLLLESLVTSVLAPERLIMEHTLLVAILHGNVGTEVGAHFLQTVVKMFHEMHQNPEIENKELDNVILILSHLYNFKVFSASLMYNILDQLVIHFSIKDIELLLLVLRSVGFALRKDNPVALRELILRLQQKAVTAVELNNSSRIKFMLDILLAIKNNNMSKIPNYDPSHSERLKKLMKCFLRKGNYVTELKISLDDLLKVEEQGRWWVVGSAWSGQLPGKIESETSFELQAGSIMNIQHSFSQQLLALARKQRMNTNVRRNIFCILMTAEDFLDAFEKLLHLKLKNQQEREIVYVTLHCCMQEKQFNMYYGLLLQKLCHFDRKYQMIVQYALWDKFKELHNLSGSQVANLAHLLVYLIIEKGLPLSVLKVINFAEVDKMTVCFLRQILLGLLLHESVDAMQQCFQRMAIAPKLHMFREGLRLFMHHFLLQKTKLLPPDDVHVLKERITTADKIFALAESMPKL